MYKLIVMVAAACVAVFLAGCVSEKPLPYEYDKSANASKIVNQTSDVDVIINKEGQASNLNENKTTAEPGSVFRWYDVSVVNRGLYDYPISGNFTLRTCDGSVYQSVEVGSVDFGQAFQKNNHTYIGDRVSGIVAFKVPAGAKPKVLRYVDYNNLDITIQGHDSIGVFINICLLDPC